ncbi:glycosyltransferase family 4 protein [Curtobacterium sp. ODYSSEY 48 V2]|uniref:glycosyltransferase family 4 protein n=1 Tax=Curtobacterium sp. ODYSSEY 48 V2 TaxID=2939561 RepID=UPI002041CBDA|nr:glycosyltransferase family 4 protein [Curtobacterium sp. ODYSSEY 48 V2]MCM3505966.1 glycosyltransferase family 4 protein [Curtobacterium sp. ODYSSEY 48 V2]
MQPYVPTYRAAFFEALATELAHDGHELVIAAGAPTGAQASRRDSAHLEGVFQLALTTTTIRLGRARLRLVSGRRAWRDADVVVAELAAGASATYEALLQRRRPVGVWGHVEAFTAEDNRITRMLRRWQTRAADHVLAYTDTGATLASRWRASSAGVTSLHNSIDVRELKTNIEFVRTSDPSESRSRLGIGDGPVFAMVGGLDESKRIDLVVEALDLLWTSRPDITLVVGGRGRLEAAFARAAARGQVRLLGYIGDELKAHLANVAIALVNPGRVGLIAVESMAMRLPIITTTGTRHGPEYEYLTPDYDSIECAPTADALATSMKQLADDPQTALRLGAAIGEKSTRHSLDHMVGQYAEALRALLALSKSRARHPRM